ncbi:chemotaxis protein CheW [Sphingomonas hylomeconis]|uniref:Chemotaxis protein CheW n=1 Tax=Sphingomonas hylomeconis TaxID=1395958 RepID=A0ABV7SVZ8_9SPHN|nr:chemotaxis protein CheW [Sphingomonas hylomeconis]
MTAIGRRLSFRVGTQRFALPLERVREVARRPVLTRVPLAPDSLAGLANLRGTVLPIVSLATLIDEAASAASWVIVLDRADPLGLLVDMVAAPGTGDDAAALLDPDALLEPIFGAPRAIDRTLGIGTVIERAPTAEAARVVLLGFLAAGQEFALPLDRIDRVMRLPDAITLLPDADAVVVGTIALHGQLLPLLALDRLLGLPRGTASAGRQRVVVVRIGTRQIGLMVDGVRAILRVDPAAIDALPAALARGDGGEARVQAICRLDDGQRLVSVLAADQLLHADLPLAPQPAEETIMTGDDRDDSEQFLLFQLGGQQFGLPIGVVSEVTALPATLTALPRAPAFVEGVMNLRGQIVPVIDQHRRFLGVAASGPRRRVVVVALDGTLAGFVVDTVSDVVRLPRAAIQPAPELGADETRVFDRIATPDDGAAMILIVSPGELLDRAERDLIAAMGGRATA